MICKSFQLVFKSLITFILLVLAPNFVQSQDNPNRLTKKAVTVISPELLFERFSSGNGLADDRIRSVFQDSRGFLWIGTMNGLCEYNGYSFKNYYKKKESNSISGNWITSLCEDGDRNLWIGTKEGLNKFDIQSEKFVSFKNQRKNSSSIPSNIITTIQFDSFGILWIGGPKGLTKFDPKTNNFKRINIYPFNTKIEKIIKSYGNYIWITTQDGVVHYDVKTGKYQVYKIQVQANAFGDKFWSIFEDNRNLYIGTGGDGLIRLNYDSKSNRYSDFEYLNRFSGSKENLLGNEIFDICKSNTGDFWLATGYGLAKVEKMETPSRQLTFYRNNPNNKRSLSNNQVYKVFIDKTNVLWSGTEQGLNKLDLYSLPFHYYTFNKNGRIDQVRSIYSKDGTNIWFGTANTGFYKFNIINNTSDYFSFGKAPSFLNETRSIFANSNDEVWLGTFAGTLKINTTLSDYSIKTPNRVIFALLKDSKQNLWIGTNKGLYKITKDGKEINYKPNPSDSNAIHSTFVRAIYEDHSGNIWLGFENGGIEKLNPLTEIFTSIVENKKKESVFGSIIYSIVEYPENVIWAGSESCLNKVVLKYKKDGKLSYRIKNYFEEDGLPDKSVNGIISDSEGNLWISTIKGLVKFNINNETFQSYLTKVNFIMSSYQKLNNHQFLFGTTDGFILFDPTAIRNDKSAPVILISDLKLFNQSVAINKPYNGEVVLNKSITSTNHITLNYRNNQFTLGFTSLHFSNPSGNKYQYKLEGFDKDWITTGSNERSATYTNLDAGNYLFKVRVTSYSGQWNQKPLEFKITILPPPWKTWWAIIIYVFLVFALFYLIIRYILIDTQQRHEIYVEKSEKEQLKNLNQMKVRFFTDVSHEFRTPLSLIVAPVEDILLSNELSDVLKKKVEMVYRNCKKLLYLIEELMTFQKMEQGMLNLNAVNMDIAHFLRDVFENFEPMAKKKNIFFNLSLPKEHIYISFDPGKMEMVMNNLIFNAFKFTPEGGTVNIKLTENDNVDLKPKTLDNTNGWLCISVEDNGKGISNQEVSQLFERYISDETINGIGIGLSLTKNLVELHKGFITAKSEEVVNKTSFKVYLPANNVNDKVEAFDQSGYDFKPVFDVSVLVDQELSSVGMISGETMNHDIEYTILIVDDNIEMLNYLEILFKGKYNVIKAENGIKALKCISKHEPDLVISDVMMPEMDGVELCITIKSKIKTCHIPVILLTAKSTIEDRIEGLETGADDYIPKPFHPNVLMVRVDNLIRGQKRLIEKYRSSGIVIPENISTNPLDEAFLQKVIKSITQNMSNEEFSVEELGDMVAMSRSNLFRKLKAITNQTPVEFICNIRLNHSMGLLLERKLSISQIAYEVGFKIPSSFTKAFRKRFAKSPTDFLNEALANQKEEK